MLFTGWLQCPWGAGLAASHVLPTPQRTIQPVEVPEHLLRKRRAWTDAGFGNRLQAAIHQLSIIALNIHEAFNLFLQLPAGLLMWILPFPLLAFVFAHTHTALFKLQPRLIYRPKVLLMLNVLGFFVYCCFGAWKVPSWSSQNRNELVP